MPAYKVKIFPLAHAAPWARAAMQGCAFILAANWCLQGMRGMDRKELAFRLGLELLLAVALAGIAATAGLPAIPATGAALLAAHTLSFTLNGQVWVCVRYCRLYRRDPAALERFTVDLAAGLARLSWLDEAALIGSRGQPGRPWGPRSDIDLRLVFPPGAAAWLRTNLLLLRLRAVAFARAIPLDLYAYDTPGSLRRLDQGERLRPLLDRRGRLAATFPERVVA